MDETFVETWVGQVDVKPRPGNDIFEGGRGALANVAAFARSPDEFIEKCRAFFTERELEVVEYHDVQRLSERMEQHDVPPEFLSLANGLTSTRPIDFDTFYVYDSDE